MDHIQIVIAYLFIKRIVCRVGKFIGFNGQDGVSDESAVVNASSVGTITMIGPERCIVYKALKGFVDCIAYTDFFGVFVDYFATRVIRK